MLLAVESNLTTLSTRVGIIVGSLFVNIFLSACVAPIAAMGASGTALSSTAGTSVASAAVANPVTATSIASTVTTGKSPVEHAASAATKKDCSFFNPLLAKPICIDIPVPTVTDNSTPLLGPADQVADSGKQ
jgi:hypothetical protein